jgi:hypothetical protein
MEKKDACYYKVKASAKVWPSAYASGRLVQCRKKGAGNYGNKSESVSEGSKDSAPKMGSKEKKLAQGALKGARDMSAVLGLVRGKDGVANPPETKKPSVAEGVAETVSMDQAKKVLSHYGADHFKTTTNELHFYKNGRHMSVDLIFNYDDATRSVSLRQLNSATRQLKGQGMAEGSQEDAKFTPRLQIRSRIGTALDQYLDPEKVAGAYTDIQYYKHDGKVYVEVLFHYTDGQKIGPKQRKQFLVNKDFTLTPIKKQGMAEAQLDEKCWDGYQQQGMKNKSGRQVPNCVPVTEELTTEQQFDMIEDMVEHLAQTHGVDSDVIWEDFESVDDHELYETAAWRRKEGKSARGGLNAKGVASYRRENPGSKLQTAVTTKPSKLKPGSKAAKRRKSFCARMGGVKGPMKKPNGKPTRKALALRKWNC